jgi:hypothetical protein
VSDPIRISSTERSRVMRQLRLQLKVGEDPRRTPALNHKDPVAEHVYQSLLQRGRIKLDGRLNFKDWA